MNKFKDILSSQIPVYLISMIFFIIAAVIGWVKLRYGFNFIDEGYHMTEAWRLTVGDHYFQDKFTGAINLSAFINSVFYRIWPDITLLGFRITQYILTICSIVLFGMALYQIDKQYWYQPLILSIIAFTGLDPVGMISNLNYQTIPNLLITIHLSFVLLGLQHQNIIIRRILFILSGVVLWCISFDLLHLSLVVFSPVFLYYILRKVKTDCASFNFKDLCSVLAPVVICWLVFIALFNKAYFLNIITSIQLLSSTSSHSAKALLMINWEAIKHISITLIFLIICIYSLLRIQIKYFLAILSALSILMFIVIGTSFFGYITPYYNGWFSGPMWFVALLSASYLLSLCYFAFKILKKQQWNKMELSSLIMIVPCMIMAVSSSIFSALGILTVLHSAIPVIAAMTCLILSRKTIEKSPYFIKFVVLLLLFAPFYCSTAYSDWKFTFFDVTPELANVEIDKGFGKGIRTNQAYQDLYTWIRITSEKYTRNNDYIISYSISPMVHMIAKRRPALDESYIDPHDYPYRYYETAIEKMKMSMREPRLAYVFEGMPALLPLKDGSFMWFNKLFSFPSDDPISRYLIENMVPLDAFKISDELQVKCYIDKAYVLEENLKHDPNNPIVHIRVGMLYQKRGDLDKAENSFKKALGIDPASIQARQNLAIVYSLKGNNRVALDLLKEIIKINPEMSDAYYNIACIYAKQNRVDDSIQWLKKAVDKGFNNLKLLQTDHDIDNIRNTMYFKEVLERLKG